MTDTTKRDAVREKVVALQDLADDLHAEIKRLRAILAALREPSQAVWWTAWDAYRESAATASFMTLPNPAPMHSAIRAAVEAAEQEVDG